MNKNVISILLFDTTQSYSYIEKLKFTKCFVYDVKIKVKNFLRFLQSIPPSPLPLSVSSSLSTEK